MSVNTNHKFATIRNLLAIIFTLGFFAMIGVHVFVSTVKIPEILMGAAIVQITLIVQFFFRRANPK